MWADAVEFNVPSDVLNVRSDLLVNNAFSDDVYPDALHDLAIGDLDFTFVCEY